VRDSVDLRVGAIAAFGLLAALYRARRTGSGQHVDVSAREAVASLVGDALVEHSITGRSPARDGNHLGSRAPYDVYRCAGDDSWVAIGVSSNAEWAGLCRSMERPDLGGDESYADQLGRLEHRPVLDAAVAAWVATRPAAEAADRCAAEGVPASVVLGIGELVSEPHLVQRDVFRKVVHPRLGELIVPAPPWRLASGLPALEAGPTFGRDSDDVLGSVAGLSSEEIVRLRAAGVVN
jgi:crotonobetainyl-CoA:carnitine CoA-transferase CaiB-like acyl-CoA transferase